MDMKTTASSRLFANRLYEKLVESAPDENLFFSPFSIQVALAMCAVGARGETRGALTNLIGAPDDVDDQNQLYADLLLSICSDGSRPTTLVTANAIWAQRGITFVPAFADAIAQYYDGVFREVNFQKEPKNAVAAINTWVSAKTNERINDLLSIDMIKADTRLVLTNAIYFKAKWEKVFPKSNTKDEPWYGPDGQTTVPLMHKQEGLLHYETDDFQAVNIPYKGRQLSMLVVLPRREDGLAALERLWIEQDLFAQVTKGFDDETVNIWLPRFKVEASFELGEILCAMGAEIAFSDLADFTGIARGPLKISEVVHKAFVEVTEDGTEAAAATAVLMMRSMGLGRAPEPIEFRADHPFMFCIWNRKTDVIFFSGRVVNP
jgi:serpin B